MKVLIIIKNYIKIKLKKILKINVNILLKQI